VCADCRLLITRRCQDYSILRFNTADFTYPSRGKQLCSCCDRKSTDFSVPLNLAYRNLADVDVLRMSAPRQERSFHKVFIMRFSHELAASRLSHGMDFSASTSLITPTSLMRI